MCSVASDDRHAEAGDLVESQNGLKTINFLRSCELAVQFGPPLLLQAYIASGIYGPLLQVNRIISFFLFQGQAI